MPIKYIIPSHERTTVAIDKEVHAIIKMFAQEYNITMVQAVHHLLEKGVVEWAIERWPEGSKWTYCCDSNANYRFDGSVIEPHHNATLNMMPQIHAAS